MDKNSIISGLAERRFVENYVFRVMGKGSYAEDICQDIYLVLLEYEEGRITGAFYNGTLEHLVLKIAKNMIRSKTSRPYYKYMLFRRKSVQLQTFRPYDEK